ncbi:hypothetical protein [Parasphingopyxis marina]|uniref:Uncharacterized protein n=1 Tax=Parasphingopyxis marina TaxID=2761622 RepID=A0A842HXW1_9SPHN|nr:hypothetical protein [Parasphingopyxis marina]MBC2777181.1 hypothetical protein [Parasphingopyxis marina]
MLPRTEIMLVAERPTVGGSLQVPVLFSAIPRAYSEMFEPLIVQSWPGFQFQGPRRAQSFDAQVVLLAGEQLHIELLDRIGTDRIRLLSRIVSVGSKSLVLASGETLVAMDVVDARETPGDFAGAQPRDTYSRSVRDISVAAAHGISRPILFRELQRTDAGIMFAQYLPLTPNMIREVIYGPSSQAAPAPTAGHGTVVSAEKSTLDAGDIFLQSGNDRHRAESLDFGSFFGGFLNSLVSTANEMAARQIRIVA